MTRTTLTGWGGTSPTVSQVEQPRHLDDLRSAIAQAGSRGVITRGLGRSYGDPAQNAGGTVLDLTGWNGILDVDTRARSVRVQAGISLDRLLRAMLPLGLWLPVVPGTRQVTVGGAIAADVHGKNHHVDGSFGHHLLSIELLVPSGDVLTLSPSGDDPELFWATVGGMGLTGIVLEATIQLKRVQTSYFLVDTERTPDLGTLLDRLVTGDAAYDYSVAWFDTSTTGSSLGRSVITRGNSARLDDLDPDLRSRALEFAAPQRGRVPVRPPISMVNRVSAKAFNALWYAKAPLHRTGEVQDITQFFHPLDVVGDWNRLYGPRGFCQYQFVVPDAEVAAFTEAVERIAASGHVSSLNVLKRFGEASPAPLSFPVPGWTLAVDLPVRPGLGALLDHLDALVVEAGGRVYLAKDSRTTPTTLRQMYPRLDEFLAVRHRVDPHGVLRSDLSRRLDL
ncbi:FAD-binding protein [Aeromicrobium sp. SMF47]|uniref:FAD-dependent oxidoreductase n=1 Tax=Aeromicrobium yanjiei TaxID=2662028 RepID=UPI00129D5B5E|nr:FAD-binding oxidoreductase [Aeromicrobium yanjiei]MRJ77737.1 FAD-binding protein [Aeromicrobium yanjiei]